MCGKTCGKAVENNRQAKEIRSHCGAVDLLAIYGALVLDFCAGRDIVGVTDRSGLRGRGAQ